MFQNFWPMFIGSALVAVAAVLTALKTGNVLLWPCAVLIIGIGTVRAFQMRKYEQRNWCPSVEQAKHWEPRYAIGAMVYASVLGVWCFLNFLQQRCGRAHDLCRRDGQPPPGGAARSLRPSQADPISHPVGLRPDVASAGDARRFFYISLAALLALFFVGLKGINLNLHAISASGADVEFPGSGAGPPVRYRAEQHAARASACSRRRAACGDESPLQPNDEPVLSLIQRRQRARHSRGLHQSAWIFGGERQDDPLGDRVDPGPRHDHHRSRPSEAPIAVVDVPGDGSGGTVVLVEDITERRNAKPGSRLWRVTTN